MRQREIKRKRLLFFLSLLVYAFFVLTPHTALADSVYCAQDAAFTNDRICYTDIPNAKYAHFLATLLRSGPNENPPQPACCLETLERPSNDCDGKAAQNSFLFDADLTPPDYLTCMDSKRPCKSSKDCKLTGLSGKCIEHTCFFTPSEFLKDKAPQSTVTDIKQDLEIKKPILAIKIPTLSGFSDIKSNIDAQGYLHLPYIGEYLAAIYKFAMVAASIVAVGMLIKKGFDIAISGGGEGKTEGYKRIGQIIIGVALMWGSYAILYNVNPELVEFKALKIKYIQPVSPDHEEPDEAAGLTGTNAQPSADGFCVDPKTLAAINGIPSISSQASPNLLASNILPALRKAGELVIQTTDPETGKRFDGLIVVSAVRTLDKQMKLFNKALVEYGSEEVARTHVGKPDGCTKGSSHLAGQAVDIHLKLDGKELQQNDMTEVRINILQDKIMTPAGWVRYCPEWWHFEVGTMEKPNRAATCDRPYGTGNSHLK